MVEVRPLGLDGVFEIRPRKFGDERGFFSEIWNAESWREAGIDVDFVQDNHSLSRAARRAARAAFPDCRRAQDKLVRVTRGAIFDVAVDIRSGSPTFGNGSGSTLSAEEWNQMLVPKGFAHGFVTLEPDTEVVYKVSAPYSPTHDRSIRFDDPAIGIDWPVADGEMHLSAKDRAAPLAGRRRNRIFDRDDG